ncbi:MAG: GH3 auxin-responsive promoter family protein [Lachnospiraceae bacterium]|nr:GH3 auxin-responsive promoter family protein [Lachnospiraceae bacterium]
MSDMRGSLKELESICRDAAQINKDTLMKILSDSGDTEFGRVHGFKDIDSADSYRKAVPVSVYKDYSQYIARMRVGEKNLLMPYPVCRWATSSGTLGGQKYIPLTDEALKRYTRYIMLPYSIAGIGPDARKLYVSVIAPFTKKEMTITSALFQYLQERGEYHGESYAEGMDLLFTDSLKDYKSIEYCKARVALSDPDIQVFQSVFIYDLILIFEYIKFHYDMIISDIENGTVSVELPEDVKKHLLSMPVPDREWLRECRRILSDDSIETYVPCIWKGLKLLIGIFGEAFPGQEETLRNYCGDVPLYAFIYASSECVESTAFRLDQPDYLMIPGNGFYEFRPKGESDRKTVLPEEVKVGGVYELIYTTFGGLYRYASGDYLKITGFVGQSPVFRMCRRTTLVFNITGEKLEYERITEAVYALRGRFWNKRIVYSVGLDYSGSPARYQLFVEGDVDPEKAGEFSKALDELLQKGNVDYEDLRGIGNLAELSVVCVSKGSHENCSAENKPFIPAQRKPLQALTEKDRQFMLKRAL